MVIELTNAAEHGREVVGGKAAVLSDLTRAGFPVPAGFVITAAQPDDPGLAEAASILGANRFAVRSSASAEDLGDTSYAGLYESYLEVPADGLADAVRACFAAANAERITAYRPTSGTAMAVLVQAMIEPSAAGVAFTADPITGDRDTTLITAVRGLAEPLVSGRVTGEQWTVTPTRLEGPDTPVLTSAQVSAVTTAARRIAGCYGRPQDIEWAIDHDGRLWILQARPMTALPAPPDWRPPGPGQWMRNFRLGEWLPEAVTPLFATWLLPLIEDGYLDAMQGTIGVRVPFRYALIDGWYYTAPPIPSLALLARILRHGGRRAVSVLFNALVRVGRNPDAADRAVLAALEQQWRDHHLPRYRKLVDAALAEATAADPTRLARIVDQLGRDAGVALWYLAIVGGSAWKMESCLVRFVRRHLTEVLPDVEGGAQILLRGLTGVPTPGHAVLSADWYHPTVAELSLPDQSPMADLRRPLEAQRLAAEKRCASALAAQPRLLDRFQRLLAVVQRYAVIREEQARTFTLAWPVLRDCVRRLGRHLAEAGAIPDPDDVFFCVRTEIAAHADRLPVAERRSSWQRQRRLAAPLTLGRPPRFPGDVIDRTVRRARSTATPNGNDILVGHPASAGRATGPARILAGPADFASLADGDVLVAKATTPAWTPLFARAAAIVTDGGTLAAHASLIAREFGIPAVVGTGTATSRLHCGQIVTVDGTAGVVSLNPARKGR